MRSLLIIPAVALGILAAVSQPAKADDGLIQGCSHKLSGAFRIVTAPSDCRKSEVPISWDQSSGSKAAVGSGGAVHVYGADGEYLGILLDNVAGGASYQAVRIFVPELHMTTSISPYTGEINKVALYFQATDCYVNGEPYVRGADVLYRCAEDGDWKYCTATGTASEIDVRSSIRLVGSKLDSWASCWNYWWSSSPDRLFQAQPISEVEIPFAVPVALPLEYEYE